MKRDIIYLITDKDFEQSIGRKPKNKIEFDKFVDYIERGMEAQLDWDILYKCTKDAMK